MTQLNELMGITGTPLCGPGVQGEYTNLEAGFLYLGPHPGPLHFCCTEKGQPLPERPWPLWESLLSGNFSSALWNWFALVQTVQPNFL